MATCMFWNLYEAAIDVRNGDDTAWQRQADIINRQRPDVLAITEGWHWHRDQEKLFRQAIHDFGFADGVLYESKTNCDMAIMWRDDTELVNVSRQPLTHAWWHGYMHATFRLRGRSEPTRLMVSHLNPFDPTLRRIEASFLRVPLQQAARALLMMDANCVPPGDPEPPRSLGRNLPGEDADRTPLECLTEAGLIDVAAAAADRRPTVGHYCKPGQPQPAAVRLDQAWATPTVPVHDYRVLDSTEDDPHIDTASDHRPIVFQID